MSLYKNMSYSPVLDVIVIKEYGAMNRNYYDTSHLEVPRPNQIISEIQDSYFNGKIMLASNCNISPIYPVTARATTNPTTITSVLNSPILLNMRTTQSSPSEISCVYESISRYIPTYIEPPHSSLNYNTVKRNLSSQSTSFGSNMQQNYRNY